MHGSHALLEDVLADELEIPVTHYELATARYKAIGEWLGRPESEVARWAPRIYAQGSFQYGTAIKPMGSTGCYDLDLVCELTRATKADMSQKALKEAIGRELRAYAKAHGMKAEPDEGGKCWHLDYADEVSFHIDVVPALPEDEMRKRRLEALLAEEDLGELAASAVAITDRKHVQYGIVGPDWPTSNPRGLARWFSEVMRPTALARLQELVERRQYRHVDEIPIYEWKTPLQRAIQVLKRHRDLMFERDLERRPISMIVLTLAARAYDGQPDLRQTLDAIVENMPKLVHPSGRRVPNPVNPEEDFADNWRLKPALRLEDAFRRWHAQLKSDVKALRGGLSTRQLQEHLEQRFGVGMAEDRVRQHAAASTVSAAPFVHVKDPPRPWAGGA